MDDVHKSACLAYTFHSLLLLHLIVITYYIVLRSCVINNNNYLLFLKCIISSNDTIFLPLYCKKTGNNMPIKDASTYIQDGTTCSNGNIHGMDAQEATESDSCREGWMREPMEGKHPKTNDTVHLQRRVGLFSGVALIVGTMIGMCSIHFK